MDIGDVDARTQSALDLAGTHVFGTEPGRIPAVLFEAYDASDADRDRALLGAALATHWGPDELKVRVDLTGKLADVAAHLGDVDARTKAHLWLLTVAAETLDVSELNGRCAPSNDSARSHERPSSSPPPGG